MSHFKPYRNCVGLLVINKNGNVFIGKRIDSNLNAWQMPQGDLGSRMADCVACDG